ncbi:MAG: Uma2 family endonuclease [Coleofasciculaceae cyanobacterium SM2_1_6]|nr:Uma2 family endonuclease [Coleofasciculaceae cyanobacterium SM2_1_6]
MIAIVSKTKMTPEEYLAWESEQDTKYEYEHGEIIEMTGGKLYHNKIALNLIILISNYLRDRDCWVLGSDAKVMTPEGVFYYPDVVVSCDDRDRSAQDFLQYSCLIAEVLSPSTESRDRGLKFGNYRKMETLQEYLLIDCDRPSLEIYRRNQNNNWELIHIFNNQLDFATANPEIHLASIDLKFSLADLYESIEFLPQEI